MLFSSLSRCQSRPQESKKSDPRMCHDDSLVAAAAVTMPRNCKLLLACEIIFYLLLRWDARPDHRAVNGQIGALMEWPRRDHPIFHASLATFWMESPQITKHGTSGLVAMTSASHAEGRQFDPGLVYFVAQPIHRMNIHKLMRVVLSTSS